MQTGDFGNTAVFSFTDLGGLTFESSTGEFLVPEPSTGLLLGVALAGAGVRRRGTPGRGRPGSTS